MGMGVERDKGSEEWRGGMGGIGEERGREKKGKGEEERSEENKGRRIGKEGNVIQ